MIISAMTRSWQDEILFGPLDQNRFMLSVGDHQVLYDIEPRQHSLMLSLGLCIARIQSFEFTLQQLLATVNASDENSADVLQERYKKLTLGNILRAVEKAGASGDLLESLADAKAQRDRVVHRILAEFEWPMSDNEKYVELLGELAKAENSMGTAERLFLRFINIDHGVPMILGDEIDRLMAEEGI